MCWWHGSLYQLQQVSRLKKSKVLCLDGDGAITMHLGALSTSSKINNMIHVVFNNDSHDSVGGQKLHQAGLIIIKLPN